MSNKLKERLIRILISLVLFIPLFVIDLIYDLENLTYLNLALLFYIVIYLIISYDILIKAFKNITNLVIFDENFLMILATFGAFATHQYPEACAVMILYQIGEFFQDLAVGKSTKSIVELMDLKQDYANKLVDGNIEVVDPFDISIGDIIIVKPGEKIPLDGIVINGSSLVDLKSLNGESIPRKFDVNDEILSGGINLNSTLTIKVTKIFENSTVNKILELVSNSGSVKSKNEKFITKFSKYYTPIVVISALLMVIIGALISGNTQEWIKRALNFLVVSCPCAIVISVPLSFFISIGASARKGILFKGSSYLEKFNDIDTFVFDKTGTLTKGNFVITQVIPEDNKEAILKIALLCEQNSNHPIAQAIKTYNPDFKDNSYELTNYDGKGIKAVKGEEVLLCGNEKLLELFNINLKTSENLGTKVYVCKNNKHIGTIIINDEIKEESYDLIKYLNNSNLDSLMLTGDNKEVADRVAKQLNISNYKHDLLPLDKLDAIKELQSNNKKVCFVGDGINDAPVLINSDIGVSMGQLGSDAAIEASDIVIMNDNLDNLINAKKISKKTIRIVKENIYFAIITKLLILVLSALGIANIWIAVFGDVGVALLCVINSFRSGKIK